MVEIINVVKSVLSSFFVMADIIVSAAKVNVLNRKS